MTCNKDKSQELEKKIQEMENNRKDPGIVSMIILS